jgi:site-specific DNA recombinase
MRQAVMYTRVSSRDQEREGYSIPAQQALLREYAAKLGLKIVREFVDVETAKVAGRKAFGEMVTFLTKNRECRVVLAEKTDRLYRNFKDYVVLEDLEIEIHLPKEGHIISKESRSHDRLIHGIKVVLSRNYIENLSEEVRKGMRQKAAAGIYPTRPPLGYQNNKADHSILVNPETAPIVQRIFELFAKGNISVAELRKQIRQESGRVYAKGYLHKILKNPFYVGFYQWGDTTYKGTHPLFVDPAMFQRVQDIFAGYNRPKHRHHEFAFGSGLLRCGYDDCLITAEIKKQRYVYYHCTGGRGKCSLPYFREEELSHRLGGILKDIYVPDSVVRDIQNSLATDKASRADRLYAEEARLQQRLTAIRSRMDQAYLDKLDGKITAEFWERKNAEWLREEHQVQFALAGLKQADEPARQLTASRTLELANKAYSLYVRQSPTEQAKLLKMVLSNCKIDAVSITPAYRKSFDLIFARAKNEDWRARRDSNSRPNAPEAFALSS